MKKINNKKILMAIGILLGIIGLFVLLINVLDKEERDNNNSSNEGIVNDNNDLVENKKAIYIVEEKSDFSLFGVNNHDDKSIIRVDDLAEEDIILGKYECVSDNCYSCYAREPSTGHYFVGNDKVLLCDGKSTEYKVEWILYNYINNKIENTFDDVLYSYDISKDDFVILVKNDNKYAIMNKDGDLITDYIYDRFPYSKVRFVPNEEYYYEKDYVVTSKNNLKGIIDVTNGATIVDFKYNDIMFSSNGLYSVFENEKWYLMDQNENKIFSVGYDYISAFDFGILVMQKIEDDKYQVKIIDYDGNDLTNSIEYFSNYIGGYDQNITKDENSIIINLQEYRIDNLFIYYISEQRLEYQKKNN